MTDSLDDDWRLYAARRWAEITSRGTKLSAQAARELTDAALIPNMNLIYAKIQEAARKGENTVSIYDREILKHKRLADKAVNELISNGYTATFRVATDQRDCDTLTISW